MFTKQERKNLEKRAKKYSWEGILKGGEIPDSHFNKKQLKTGTKIELEHTDSRLLAKQIAKAHLLENKNYYIKLKRMGL